MIQICYLIAIVTPGVLKVPPTTSVKGAPGGGVARNHNIELGHAGDEVRCLSSIVYMRAATAKANNDWQGNCGEIALVNFSGGGSAQGILLARRYVTYVPPD